MFVGSSSWIVFTFNRLRGFPVFPEFSMLFGVTLVPGVTTAADWVYLATTKHKMNVHVLRSNHVISLRTFIPIIYTI